MEDRSFIPKEPLRTLEAEKSHIQDEVLAREEKLENEGNISSRDELISQTLGDYKKLPQSVVDDSLAIKKESLHALVENLSPETHDKKIEELLTILNEKGIKNVLSVIEKIGNTHLEDDLHRFLVQYVKKGFPIKGMALRAPLSKALRMTLYEVTLPEAIAKDAERSLKEILSGMEQFYAGMFSISSEKGDKDNHMVVEIANSNGSEEFVFYVAVPDSKKDLLEKQILSIFHEARINEVADDHNVFNENGESAGALAEIKGNAIFPLKTYEQFDHDPLNVVLNSFSKLKKEGEGACLQVLVKPAGNIYKEKFTNSLEKIEKGISAKEAISSSTVGDEIGKVFKEIFSSPKKKTDKKEEKVVDTQAIEAIRGKLSKPIVNVAIRVVSSAADGKRAEEIISDIESGFNQFGNTKGAEIKFKKMKGGSLKKLLRKFAFRAYDRDESIPLNLSELSTVMHFHTTALKGVSQLRTVKAGGSAVPLGLPQEGTLLGVNKHRSTQTEIYLSDEDRLRHFYTIGQTGTGKSTLLKNMIIQDIMRGNGVCMIDPHGSDILDVLSHVPAERASDVIYFDPSFTERPMALNMLEYDRNYPEQKTFVVNELFNIFQKLYGAVPESMGPMFEQYFRNATMLVIEDPDSGSTLLDVSRVLSNSHYRQLKLSKCGNPVVSQFWREIAEKAGGEARLENIVPYITSKFDVFLANDIMRPIVAQEHSSFNFRDIMDNRKILLVNLAKGRLGDINANLIGLILVGKILMASLSRVDVSASQLPPFYLYIDEFQNITTPSIATILSEARKYKLSLSIAHQFIGQLDENIKNAVFGNVGTIVAFRVGSDDAEYLVKQFEPVFNAQQLVNVENRHAYIKMLSGGKPVKPFDIETMPTLARNQVNMEAIIEYSMMSYGRERSEVEKEIMQKYENK